MKQFNIISFLRILVEIIPMSLPNLQRSVENYVASFYFNNNVKQ